MTFEGFKDYVTENIWDYLPEEWEDAEIKVTQTKKLGEEYTALIVKKPDTVISPSINLDAIYEHCNEDIEMAMEKIAEMACMEPEGLDLNGLTDYAQAKKDLFIRVSNADKNAELLSNVPHNVIGDIAVTCHIKVMENGSGMGTVLVNDALLETFGVTKEKLFIDAVENCRLTNPPVVEDLESRVMSMLGMEGIERKDFDEAVSEMKPDGSTMYILTNESGFNGAAVLMYPGLLEDIGKGVGGNFCIIPSSVHECILIPGHEDNFGELEAMLREVNRTEVSEKDFLSDSVYHYDVKEKLLEKAEDFADRKFKEEEKDSEVDGGGRPKKAHKNKDYER